jgi:hypothetical protein
MSSDQSRHAILLIWLLALSSLAVVLLRPVDNWWVFPVFGLAFGLLAAFPAQRREWWVGVAPGIAVFVFYSVWEIGAMSLPNRLDSDGYVTILLTRLLPFVLFAVMGGLAIVLIKKR